MKTIFILNNLFLSTALLMSANVVFAQNNNVYLLANEWNEGQIDAKGNVIDGGIRRGGWDYLTLNSDSTVTYASAFTCGMGAKQTGTWKIDRQSNLVIFLFTHTEGYLNNPINGDIERIETYLIEKLTETELILLSRESISPKRKAFFKNTAH